MKIFETIAGLTAAHLKEGQIVETKGYTSSGDGGQARYLIQTAVQYAGAPDEYGDHTLANGNVAVLQHAGSVKEFGAIGDGNEVFDAAITATDNTLTSSTAVFSSADVGKLVHIEGAGAAGVDLLTTITAVTNSTEVEVADAASTSVIGARLIYGSDDTPAFVAARGALEGAAIRIPQGSYFVSHNQGQAADGSFASLYRGGVLYSDADFPITLREQERAGFRSMIAVPNGGVGAGFAAMSINGDLQANTLKNFKSPATPDNVVFTGTSFRGSDGAGFDGTNPIVASHFQSWFENNTALVWCQEIDVQNEGTTLTQGDDTGGVGVVINTGSTFSPSTGVSIRRQTGAGTGPGFLRGIEIKGARETGIKIQAMAPATYPGMSPAAPGSISAIQVDVSGDTDLRYSVDQNGATRWGSGSSTRDVRLSRHAAGGLRLEHEASTKLSVQLKSEQSSVAGSVADLDLVGHDSIGASTVYGRVSAIVTANTDGAESGRLELSSIIAGSNQVHLRAGGSAANPISIVVAGTLKNVTEGAADSGGAGFKLLRVPN